MQVNLWAMQTLPYGTEWSAQRCNAHLIQKVSNKTVVILIINDRLLHKISFNRHLYDPKDQFASGSVKLRLRFNRPQV